MSSIRKRGRPARVNPIQKESTENVLSVPSTREHVAQSKSQVNVGSSSRTRISSAACGPCKKRKGKCSKKIGDIDPCYACLSNDTVSTCIIDLNNDKRRPGGLQRVIELKEQEIIEMQQKLNEAQGSSWTVPSELPSGALYPSISGTLNLAPFVHTQSLANCNVVFETAPKGSVETLGAWDFNNCDPTSSFDDTIEENWSGWINEDYHNYTAPE